MCTLVRAFCSQVELEQARRWRPDLQERSAHLETAVVDRANNRVQVVARDASNSSSRRKLRRSIEKVDVVTAHSQYHWRDDFAAPEAYRRVQVLNQSLQRMPTSSAHCRAAPRHHCIT